MKTYRVTTPAGEVRFVADRPDPDVVLIHGFKRFPKHFFPWRERIPGLGYIHLPGHGGAPELKAVSVEAWIEALRHLTNWWSPPPVLIGESLGSVVALNLRARAVVAVEPLLSTHELWPLHRTIRNARAHGLDIGPEYEALFDEPFHWVLDKISAPTLVIAGNVPLLPERPVFPEPSLLTETDFAAYARHPLVVGALRISGGHNLFDANLEGVLSAAAPFLAQHGVAVAPPAHAD